MKMIMIMSIAEHERALKKVFAECKVQAYSEMDVEGYKKQNEEVDTHNWFASNKHSVYSKMAITFIDDDQALVLMDKIKVSTEQYPENPFHAVMMTIEQSV